MKKRKRTEYPGCCSDSSRLLSLEELIRIDRNGRDEKKGLEKPLKDLRKIEIADRKEVRSIVAKYRAKLRSDLKKHQRAQGISPATGAAMLESRVREDLISLYDLRGIALNRQELLKLPLRRFAPYVPRFDWRTYGVVPRVRIQDESTCWACVATEAFESSLMIQRANFGVGSAQLTSFVPDQVSVNVNCTVTDIPPKKQGRHEPAFNHYVRHGIPLNEIKLDDVENRDGPLDAKRDKSSPRVKAIAWDWVSATSWRTPLSPRAIRMMKGALLEYGPLAVMVARDEKFKNYGRTDSGNSGDSSPSETKVHPSGDDDPVFEDDAKGINHFVLLIGWDNDKCAWIIQNTFANWGYACKGPQLRTANSVTGGNGPESENHGFMYIGYGCNQIGQSAAWIEASLLEPKPLA